jgi:hypothetical protein
MERKDTVEIAVSLGFAIINLVLEYLRNAGVSEDIIDANWETVKVKHATRPSDNLQEV